ncbi:MAG: translation initiation factor IF-3 C-terminal domain-containing protein, partial [Thermomicrobiaceae bacterium]|nr:translation initiation factor IF-3 C-terminal domain-containing protein [Thermomicrobiaceae bacterium]
VKFSVLFRGREISHQEIGQAILERLAQQLSSVGTVDQPPHLEGRTMVMQMSPSRVRAEGAPSGEAPGESA